MSKKVTGKLKPLSVGDYGDRIKRAIYYRLSRTGEKHTLKDIGRIVAQLTGRKTPFTAGTVSGWLESRGEPSLVIFLALARWTGIQAGYLAFGQDGVEDTTKYEPATEPPPGYYTDITLPPEESAEKRKRG